MAKNFGKIAENIIENVGGISNITNATHCATRLRFELKDFNIIEEEEIKKIEGVSGAVKNGGQYQIILGSNLSDVYREVSEILPDNQTPDSRETDTRNEGVLNKVIGFLTGIFTPIIIPLTGSGMLKALLAILTTFNLISAESQTYYIMSFVADSIFYFLPILLAFSTANKLKANPYIAAVLGGVLLHPNFSALVGEGASVELFGLPVGLYSYAASVIPIILIIIVQKYIEDFSRRITPETLSVVLVPMITLFLTSIIALVAVGPLGFYAGEVMSTGFAWLAREASWIPPLLVGALQPIMVMFGLHHAIAPVGIVQLAATGSEGIWGPGSMVSNVSMGAAMIGTALASKEKKIKQLSVANGITAFMGITEPALFAVALPKKYPLISAIIGGGLGGLYAGITGTVRYATGVSGIPAVVLYIGEDYSNLINILIAIAITILSTGILSFILGKRFEKNEKAEPVFIQDEPVLVTLENTDIFSPVQGEAIELSKVKDEVFSSGALGKGIAIKPEDGKIYAPFDGEIVSLFPTNHAIGLKSETGVELLIHIGIDTVELDGQYFDSYVNQNQKVNRGDLLISFELDQIKEAGYDTVVMIVVTNSDEFEDVNSMKEMQFADNETKILDVRT